jgi:hypothetical protein
VSGIHIKPANKGKLHAKLGVPQGQPIPAKKLAKAKASSSPVERKEATFAQNAKTWNKPAKQETEPVDTDRGKFGIKAS